MTATLAIALFPLRVPGGPIDFDVQLGGSRVEGRLIPTDPEWAAADEAVSRHVPGWTFSGATSPVLEIAEGRVHELAARRWK